MSEPATWWVVVAVWDDDCHYESHGTLPEALAEFGSWPLKDAQQRWLVELPAGWDDDPDCDGRAWDQLAARGIANGKVGPGSAAVWAWNPSAEVAA